MNTPLAYFDEMHRSDDPWGFRSRWYEERKRNLLLAMLPARRYQRGWEVGCSTGELSARLAERCDRLLASDGSDAAVALAAHRLQAHANAEVMRLTQPEEWPPGRFDLIVFSEVGYFLGHDELRRTVARFAGSLAGSGVLIAGHWRRSFAEATMTGDEVHRILEASLPMQRCMSYRDADVVLQGWSVEPDSVAEKEGIV
ncbi:class I SAM-dependent methyltransferase [Lysobacter sp. H23M47]|uniref:class I SAM-dependent DNA methyltransferase n=1 Tax=Lysobacter sp. H23M47 TaxID=2781024 RepID=UPI0018802634|nr:class I SAM-dependent methyltransferase [Lysobacter sp. H23M47]QOW24426.1 methyltransferase domain-containing protein [Lysobacter sp. H23M47]